MSPAHKLICLELFARADTRGRTGLTAIARLAFRRISLFVLECGVCTCFE
jgi:hypothetical protein